MAGPTTPIAAGALCGHGFAHASALIGRIHHDSGHGLSPGRHRNGGWQAATVTSISPNQITAVVPPAATGVTGSVDLEVDDEPDLYAAAVIPGGVSYDSGTGDALTINTAPSNTVPIGEPLPFSVTALGSDLTPAGALP